MNVQFFVAPNCGDRQQFPAAATGKRNCRSLKIPGCRCLCKPETKHFPELKRRDWQNCCVPYYLNSVGTWHRGCARKYTVEARTSRPFLIICGAVTTFAGCICLAQRVGSLSATSDVAIMQQTIPGVSGSLRVNSASVNLRPMFQ